MVQQAVSVFPHITWSALNSRHIELATHQSAPELLIKALTLNFHCLLLNLSMLSELVTSCFKLCHQINYVIDFGESVFLHGVSFPWHQSPDGFCCQSVSLFFFEHDARTVRNCYLSAPSVKNIHVLLSFCSYLPPKTFIWSGWTGTTQSIHDYLDHISALVLPFITFLSYLLSSDFDQTTSAWTWCRSFKHLDDQQYLLMFIKKKGKLVGSSSD